MCWLAQSEASDGETNAYGYDEAGQAIDLIYESGYEEELIEVVGRLDEIGDLVDGAVSKAEIDDLVRLIGM